MHAITDRLRHVTKPGVTARLATLTMIAAISVVVMLAASMITTRENLYAERERQTQQLVETAIGVVDGYIAREATGELTREQAQKQAAAALKVLRYDSDNYFWVNDMAPKMVMHPVKPELDGTDLTDDADPNGKHLFVEMVNVVKSQRAGFVEYEWAKPGSDSPQPKIAYVQGVPHWGWVVGSGLWVDDIDSAAWVAARGQALAGGIGLVLLMLVAWRSVRRIGTALGAVRRTLERVAAGDLTARVQLAGNDDLARMARAVDTAVANNREVIQQLHAAAETLSANSTQLEAASAEITEVTAGTAGQAQSMNAAADAMTHQVTTMASGAEQMHASIAEIARNAADAAVIANEAVAVATDATHSISRLGTSSAEIGNVIALIDSIAKQTNLLALNATIEAARAGEQGKGFAVVATEVKDLANETAKATAQVVDRITAIQDDTGAAVQAIERITGVIEQINDYQTTIAAAVEQQAATTTLLSDSAVTTTSQVSTMNEAIRTVSSGATGAATNAQQVNASATNLGDLAASIRGLTETFTV
ncbi:methyl-accepting chemotaxis protein [Couchioplanes caeruleus]|uniref:Methyl-accepting chemotaxis sensory transducer with Cache sensor n=2 Tax=Couchioplanes caeruleus TaxID=56438 RepID=A0A1K0GUX8_9ACTN|nr:methyl-accepting chemotaxis protein [Couchioplanes caeruleus]OJF13203.1 hypothetical protein BG844_16445 [Couchioplanes caeruleus subsp. caeruleus]ROP27763.1 methyl-accepting chemotaxis sensory transducer with Cache sensor [Couchioplanes caeruleus]